MTNMIEVPRELIEAGDMDAIKKLLPQPESLFGRMATHSRIGRVMCYSHKTFQGGQVRISYEQHTMMDGSATKFVPVDSITFDPLTLTTVEDFENAPEGTIVENDVNCPVLKGENGEWVNEAEGIPVIHMVQCGPWDVVRWGDGK